jgi:hypothetical protein
VSIRGISTRNDREDFLALFAPTLSETGKVRPVHGKLPHTEALDMALHKLGFADVAVPHREDQVHVA